jgi:hypothetical protein
VVAGHDKRPLGTKFSRFFARTESPPSVLDGDQCPDLFTTLDWHMGDQTVSYDIHSPSREFSSGGGHAPVRYLGF